MSDHVRAEHQEEASFSRGQVRAHYVLQAFTTSVITLLKNRGG
jgi:hypothetical protein